MSTRRQRSELRKDKYWSEREKAARKTKDPGELAVLAWAGFRTAVKSLPRDAADEMWRKAAEALGDLRELAMKPADHRSHHTPDHTGREPYASGAPAGLRAKVNEV